MKLSVTYGRGTDGRTDGQTIIIEMFRFKNTFLFKHIFTVLPHTNYQQTENPNDRIATCKIGSQSVINLDSCIVTIILQGVAFVAHNFFLKDFIIKINLCQFG